MNELVAKYAPKNRCYGASMSLHNRISIAIGIQNYGHFKFFSEVMKRLGIKMSNNLEAQLKKKDAMKDTRRKYQQQPYVKNRRIK